ncbi:N-acetylmuramoyl-L-alanine amidase [Clostridium cellulovorans]|uniref:Cell wall hydrolase/autolysin n=1 Tax=Clostridium cellulovorans (strain ATCC 35296 / DSM 3052 / OCM 3 / 743B) TaxID=573061 RepID=D9SX54_CLOC7|nr:N-acetylmuramoyl-L-alanine amidase [Clostridium cellulovorans]ADL53357.1 cell wall hydrolase/autolysin [Clostridium cellulovorans 743B]
MRHFIKTILIALSIMFFCVGMVEAKDITILIDPGHGGLDGGAKSAEGLLEKHINLKIGTFLKECLEEGGYKVHMTRTEDISLHTQDSSVRSEKLQDLHARCEMKNSTECDIFISIHLNAFPEVYVKGPQVWYASNIKSKLLAEVIQKYLEADLEITKKRFAKDAKNSYIILRNPTDRADVLVECGFLSNPEEAQKLNNEEYQRKISKAIKAAIDNYVERQKDLQ